jgi:hypothetical protein
MIDITERASQLTYLLLNVESARFDGPESSRNLVNGHLLTRMIIGKKTQQPQLLPFNRLKSVPLKKPQDRLARIVRVRFDLQAEWPK